jgi:protein-serine/threonine kinase
MIYYIFNFNLQIKLNIQGDLMTMLIKYDTFSEDTTRFYMAECALALEAVHNLGFVHRDIKPDNRNNPYNSFLVLIDREGHLKLSDFGLATGFHKMHDSTYYQKLLSSDPNLAVEETKNIDLTLSREDRLATWKKNRRALVMFFR